MSEFASAGVPEGVFFQEWGWDSLMQLSLDLDSALGSDICSLLSS